MNSIESLEANIHRKWMILPIDEKVFKFHRMNVISFKGSILIWGKRHGFKRPGMSKFSEEGKLEQDFSTLSNILNDVD